MVGVTTGVAGGMLREPNRGVSVQREPNCRGALTTAGSVGQKRGAAGAALGPLGRRIGLHGFGRSNGLEVLLVMVLLLS